MRCQMQLAIAAMGAKRPIIVQLSLIVHTAIKQIGQVDVVPARMLKVHVPLELMLRRAGVHLVPKLRENTICNHKG